MMNIEEDVILDYSFMGHAQQFSMLDTWSKIYFFFIEATKSYKNADVFVSG